MKTSIHFQFIAALAAGVFAFGAQAAEKLPTDYGDPANDLASGSVEGLAWTGAARAYNIGTDIVLVFTNTTAGSCSFEIAPTYLARGRYLLVGGGGPGGSSKDMGMVGGGGGAGGFVEANDVSFDSGDYSLTVGAGGEPNGWKDDGVDLNQNNNGKPSYISYGGADFARALGGGGGGIPTGSRNDNGWKHAAGHPYGYASNDKVGSNYDYSKVDVACGGGGAGWAYWGYWQNADDSPAGRGGWVNGDQGKNGGNGTSSSNAAGGGGGASKPGENAVSGSVSGAGGDGKLSDITGEEVWYAGGGAGGAFGSWGTASVLGGVGGGGGSGADSYNQPNRAWSDNGTDGLGGGGAGCSGASGASSTYSLGGKGGDGVVIVRLKVAKNVPLEGLTFSGESEWFNVGEGDEKETVIVFKNTDAAGSFTLACNANARILVVGGGGPGGNHNQGQVLGGGGAGGGVIDAAYADYFAGTYAVTVGKGGVANGDYNNPVFNNNGAPSFIMRGETEVLRALGGGGGGVPNNSGNWKVACGNPYGYCTSDDDKSYDFTKVDVANGGGAAICGGPGWCDAQHPGKVGELGHDGGKAVKCGNTFDALLNAGGGAGAGEDGHDATGYGASGAGGNGVVSDITGEEVYYGGGGAGGTFGAGSGVTALVNGGLGGGGKAYVDDSTAAKVFAENGVDGLGGGGAGASLSGGTSPRTKAFAGRGGNGVVIVRVKKVYPAEEPIEGVSFTGAAEWYNLGHGKTRETVIVYTNVNEAGTLTLARRATARVLLVGGGGAGGYEGAGNLVGAGGGAGGFVEKVGVALKRGAYSIIVGKGGEPNGNKDSGNSNPNGNGTESKLIGSQAELFCALGGGAGGIANGNSRQNLARGKDGGSGGGSGSCNGNPASAVGQGLNGQGCNGGNAKGGGAYRAAGGGGGAGGAAADAPSTTTSSAGGDGKVSDITGTGTWYAGGGAGGAWSNAVGDKTISGGRGGGGKSCVHVGNTSTDVSQTAYAGEDGLGGGGAGSAGIDGAHGLNVGSSAGRGGNGVVIVRITEVLPLGLSVIMQ